MSHERPLRLLTILTTAIAVPLNLATTIVSAVHEHRAFGGRWNNRERPVTTFCFAFIPMVMTVVACIASLQYMKKHGKTPTAIQFILLDLASVLAYLGVLIPIWAVEIGKLIEPGFGLLVGYTTAPLIINLFLHIYFTTRHLRWKQCFSKVFGQSSACQQCPNCQQKFIIGTSQTTTNKGYNLLRGEEYLEVEADHIAYRDSDDFLGPDAEQAEPAEPAEDSGKGKTTVEV